MDPSGTPDLTIRGIETDLCIYALSEFIEYFKSRSTSVYVAFLDASKAFNKISHWTLFIGYEPADLTVHPPPKTIEGGFIFFA